MKLYRIYPIFILLIAGCAVATLESTGIPVGSPSKWNVSSHGISPVLDRPVTCESILSSNMPFVNVRHPDFGAIGDGISDDTAAIQAAIDSYYKGEDGGNIIFLPAGVYRITDTIHLGYGTTFTSLTLIGAGKKYRAGSNFHGTAIIADFTDRPAIAIQGARSTRIEGITIYGSHTYISDNYLATELTTVDDTDKENWSGTASDSQYAPYAAIAIDPYSGERPDIHYPDVDYPEFLGTVAQYNKNYSSDVSISDVAISNFIVGIVNQPCNADGNGDFTTLHNVSIERCKYGVSVGNTQSRNFGMYDCEISTVYAALVNNVHGRKSGKWNGTISNLSVSRAINIFSFGSSAYFGPLSILHLYAESIWRIGDISFGSSNETSISINGSQFKFGLQIDSRGVPPTSLYASNQPGRITFRECSFVNYPNVIGIITGPYDNAKFEQCSFDRSNNTPSNEYEWIANNATSGGIITQNLYSNAIHTIIYDGNDLTSGVYKRLSIIDGKTISSRELIIPLLANYAAGSGYQQEKIITPNRIILIDKDTALSNISISNKTLSLTYNSRTEDQFVLYGPSPGDVLYDDETSMVFYVSSRDGTTVTAIAQNNYRSNGSGGYECIVPFSLTEGHIYVGNSRFFTTTYPTFGDISDSSSSIINVGRKDLYSDYIGEEVLVNDYIYVDSYNSSYFTSGKKIIGVDSVGKTITVTSNGSENKDSQRLKFFIRNPEASIE